MTKYMLSAVAALGIALSAACAPSATLPGQQPTSSAPEATVAPKAEPKAVARPQTVAEIATYRGPDRQQVLEEGARREGQLLLYTTLIVDQAIRPLKAAFEKKYPFITLEYYRANSGEVAQRAINEYQARRYEVDLIDGTTSPQLVKAAGFLQPFHSPMLDVYGPELKDRQGYWATTNLYFMTGGYNTSLVRKGEQPKTYQDLLDPKWKGKMIWSTSGGSGAPVFVGNILMTMGEQQGMDYLSRLAQQDIRNSDASARAVLDMVIAGEAPIALQIFNHHAVISAKQGAPSDWFPLEPVPSLLQTIGLMNEAPHPHAAILFLDFILSEEGQRVLQQADYLPAHPKVPPTEPKLRAAEGGFKANFIDPEEGLRRDQEWTKLFRELFLR